ncbi:hypothetical protein O181_071566 [Austropuccinia psidii MF-1]|uniref:CCHC-type domain-containing protein n=1 Tax=Austropuccinia psidii MF-1 TaxID=1389203 RepID=A0A9Q3I6M8_9BASI|nr:hypothetical protein [Austropuccinia psidii MF-1]
MSGSTHSKKAANNNTDAKALSNEVYSLLNSLQSEVSSLKSARTSDTAKMQFLQMALSSPLPALSPYHPTPCTVSSAYKRFMQEPYRAVDQSSHLQCDGSNFAKWVAGLNQVLCIALNSKLLVDDCPTLMENWSPQDSRAILHFIDATIPPPMPCASELSRRAQRLRSFLILSRRGAALLGVEADELEGLLAQAACHAPPSLGQVAFDQLVMAEILAKGYKKPLSTFVSQIIMSASQKDSKPTQYPSPFIYRVSEPLDSLALYSRPQSPHFPRTLASANKVCCPPEYLVNKLGGSCFQCGCAGHWRADCLHTRWFANPNLRPPLPGPSCPMRQGMPEH